MTCEDLTDQQKKAQQKEKRREIYINTRWGSFENRLNDILYAARSRAKNKGLEFSISEDNFEPQTHCKLLPDRAFKFDGTRKEKQSSMSIDRLDTTKGYTPENTWLICSRANTIKSNATFEEFETIYLNWKAELIRRGMKP